MKKTSLLFISICFTFVYADAQKAMVQTAYNYYKKEYEQFDKAKEAIDQAALNEQSASMAKTWYYRGLIYHALYKSVKYGSLCDNCLTTAYESFQKAMTLDPKNEWADEIKEVRIPMLANSFFDQGVTSFTAKDYNKALASFETVLNISPANDTAAILNCAYSADRAGKNEKAIQYYKQLIGMKYYDEKIYLGLSKVYLQEKDTVKALSTVRDGRTIFPDSTELMFSEINLLLATGKNEEATKALTEATKKDPNNPKLYLILGNKFDAMANPHDEKGKELTQPANYDELMSKAEDAYKQGLTIDPDNFELNYDLGVFYFNQGAEMSNKANELKSNDDYNKAKEKFSLKFKQSEPFLEKALDKNPRKTEDDIQTYKDNLNSLKQLYARTGESEKYEKIKALIDQK